MKILFFTQHFNLPDEPGFSRPYQFAKRWAERGNNVTVITSSYNYHAGKIIDRYANRFIFISDIERIKVIRIGLRGYSFKNWILFSIIATLISLFIRRKDIIFASSKPLTTGIPALLISLLWQRPFLLEVRDLYSRNSRLRFFPTLEKILYKQAKKIIGVSKGICENIIEKGKPKEDVIYIPHGIDDWVLKENSCLSPSHKNSNHKFKCVLSAAIMKNEVDFGIFLEAIKLLRNKTDIHFFVIGTGNLLGELKSKRFKNIVFLGSLSKKKTIDYIKFADLCLLPLRQKVSGYDSFDWITPVKLFDYFGCARPVVAVAWADTREIINKSGGGIVIESDNPELLVDAILYIKSLSAEERHLMGKRGFEYAKKFHNLTDLADRIEALMKSRVKGRI